MRARVAGTLAIAAVLSATTLGVTASAAAPVRLPIPMQSVNVYSASFMCGDWDKSFALEDQGIVGPVKPGDYATVINVHNPNFSPVSGVKKAVLLTFTPGPAGGTTTVPEQPMPPGQLVKWTLEPDWGFEIDCTDIRTVLLKGNPNASAPFIEGWVVIEIRAPVAIDVDAIYTGHTFGPMNSAGVAPAVGFALQTERINPTEVPLRVAASPVP